MKKFISALLAVSMLAVSTPAVTVDAAFELPKTDNSGIHYVVDDSSNGMKKGSNPDLKALASSLGSDTDYFNFPNYQPKTVSQEILDKLNSCGEGTLENINAEGAFIGMSGGICHGFAALQVLTHNGIILPSDIQEGAETLNDIVFDDHVNDVLCYYAMMQCFGAQEMVYHEYFCSHDIADQCRDLIKYGEQAVKNDKYFLIAIETPELMHATVGIGIADGNWTYNKKNYDKCILTLDNNSVNPDDMSKAGGFKEKACIFVNSKTNEFYFPGYGYGSGDENTFVTCITDDNDLLNHYGLIKPSKSINPDYYDIKKIYIGNSQQKEYNIYVDSKGKTEKYHGYPETYLEGITKNSWALLSGKTMNLYFRKADSITIESLPENGFSDNLMYISMLSCDIFNEVTGYRNFRGTVEEDKVSITNLCEGENAFCLELTKGKYFMPYTDVSADGPFTGTVSMEMLDDGIVLSGTKGVKCFLELIRYDLPIEDPDGLKLFNITASSSVKVNYDEKNDSFYFTIGKNFDTVVEKGDANCDGKIDAIDASVVLSGYAAKQTGGVNFVNESLGDYNSDGKIDAVDASMILSYYAYTQTHMQ